jgi:RNA polymerase sigma-70 factor (ECF subfamily)
MPPSPKGTQPPRAFPFRILRSAILRQRQRPAHGTMTDELPPPPPGSSPPGEVDQLMAAVYDELRLLAGKFLRGGAAKTLQPTALVHEAYLRLLEQRRVTWNDRTHFFRVAAQMMRRVLVDYWRAKKAVKRAGQEVRVTLSDQLEMEGANEVDLVAVDQALASLEAFDPQQARIVELRFFTGLTVEETAQALGISTATVKREWAVAKAWMAVELGR